MQPLKSAFRAEQQADGAPRLAPPGGRRAGRNSSAHTAGGNALRSGSPTPAPSRARRRRSGAMLAGLGRAVRSLPPSDGRLGLLVGGRAARGRRDGRPPLSEPQVSAAGHRSRKFGRWRGGAGGGKRVAGGAAWELSPCQRAQQRGSSGTGRGRGVTGLCYEIEVEAKKEKEKKKNKPPKLFLKCCCGTSLCVVLCVVLGPGCSWNCSLTDAPRLPGRGDSRPYGLPAGGRRSMVLHDHF